jgi:hypothetical protein
MVTIKLYNLDNISSFIGGALLGGLGSFKIWLQPLQVHTGNVAADLAIEWAIKVCGTVILGTVGGITGLATKDLYQHLKRKLKKK